MKKLAVAALFLALFAVPAFARRHHDSHTKTLHAQNPYLKHHVHRKPHAVGKH